MGTPHKPDQNVVEFLKEMLEAAEAGEINGIAIGIAYSDGAWSYGLSGAIGTYGMVGALEAAKANILRRVEP